MSSSDAGVSLFEQISFPATWLQLIIHQAYTRTHTHTSTDTCSQTDTPHSVCTHTHTHKMSNSPQSVKQSPSKWLVEKQTWETFKSFLVRGQQIIWLARSVSLFLLRCLCSSYQFPSLHPPLILILLPIYLNLSPSHSASHTIQRTVTVCSVYPKHAHGIKY